MYMHVSKEIYIYQKALKATNLDYKELFYWYAIIKAFTLVLSLEPSLTLFCIIL